eukprot:g349.t1
MLIKPTRTLSITIPIKLESYFDPVNASRSGAIQEDHRSVMTCPEKGNLFRIMTPEFTLSNIRIANCVRSSDVISLNISHISKNENRSRILLHGVEFTNLVMSRSKTIVKDISQVQISLELANVRILENVCGHRGCFILPKQSHMSSSFISSNSGQVDFSDNSVFRIQSQSEFLMEDTRAVNNSIRVFYVESDAGLEIKGSYFARNVEPRTLWESKTAGRGAVLFADHAKWINISKCDFESNLAGSAGGAIFVTTSSVRITNCMFFNNTVVEYFGGVIYFVGESKLDISNSSFIRNQAGGDGAAVYLRQDCMATITSCQFGGNKTPRNGGDIYMYDRVQLELSNSTMNGSSAEKGGAISIQARSNAKIVKCQFQNNEAIYEAGALFVYEYAKLIVYNSSFSIDVIHDFSCIGNIARRHGGAIRVNIESDATITDCEFEFNSVQEMDATGGAISIPYRGKLVLSKSSFFCNTARYGGGIYLRENTNAIIRDCTFSNNTGFLQGGAIIALSEVNLDILRSTFISNEGGNAGALYAYKSSSATILDSIFTNNKGGSLGGGFYLNTNSRLFLVNSTFIENIGEKGGVISLSEDSTAFITSCNFNSNEAIVTGGAIMTDSGAVLTISNSKLTKNTAKIGGALGDLGNSSISIRNCFFSDNYASRLGGAIKISSSTRILLTNSRLIGNRGGAGAAAHGQKFIVAEIDQCIFEYNIAALCGGALRVKRNSILNVTSSNFIGNRAGLSGGAVSASYSNVTLQLSKLDNNEAEFGGSVHGNNSLIKITNSKTQNNIASNAGGFLAATASSIILESIWVSFSQAGETGGGIFADLESHLYGQDLSIVSNVANKTGGGVALLSDATFLCYSCKIKNNSADSGGGVYIVSQNKEAVVAQFQDTIFDNNIGRSYGGGMAIKLFVDRNVQCKNRFVSCSRVILLNTNFTNNSAQSCGAAILSTDPHGVLVSCAYKQRKQESFLTDKQYQYFHSIHPKRLCSSWKGNWLPPSAYGGVVGTYGREFSFSLNSLNQVKMSGNISSGFVLKNVRSGERVSSILVTIVDIYGNGPAPTFDDPVEVVVSSPDGFFQGNISLLIQDSIGEINQIIGFKPPGNYTILIIPQNPVLITANLTVIVRGCQVDEEPTTGNELCQDCGQIAYNFNPLLPGGCTPCPAGATCEGRYIVPRRGKWHKSPCHIQIKNCLSEDACRYTDRRETLQQFTTSFTDCSMNDSVLEEYSEIQCNKGYKGILCGSCKASYGLSSNFKCLHCPHIFVSILTLLISTGYLLATSTLSVQGALPSDITESEEQREIRTALLPYGESSTPPSQQMEVNIDQNRSVNGGASATLAFNGQQRNSTVSNSIDENTNEIEVTKMKINETVKILINFLQMISTAATINVDWTEAILSLFRTSEYTSAEVTSALSGPIDCLLTSHSTAMRSVTRLLLGIFVPSLVIGIFAATWALITIHGKLSWSYFWRRFTLSVVTVTYISYLGLTKLAIKVFYCIDVYDNDNPASSTATKYLAMDTEIQCYQGSHLLLMIIALVVLVLVTVCFPVISAIVLARNQEHYQEQESWIRETMSFLYSAFREEYVYWESLVMLRKAFLSIIVVFSYSLGGQAQGLLVLIILMLSHYFKITCKPYKEVFDMLNYYESASLVVSSLTFTLSQFFNVDRCSESTREFISVLMILLVISFTLFLLMVIMKEAIVYLRITLQTEGFYIPVTATVMELGRMFITTRLRKYFRRLRVRN